MINAFGAVFGTWSFAVHSRHFFRALHRRTPVALFADDRAASSPILPVDLAEMLANAQRGVTAHPSIGIGGIAIIPRIRGRRRIAYVVWEPTRVPDELKRHLQHADELWTPSEWGRQMLIENGIAEERVCVIPEGVDPALFHPLDDVKTDDDVVRFLTVSRWEPRKGLADVVDAFLREFRRDEPVRLIVHGGKPDELRNELRARGCAGDSRFVYSRPRDFGGMVRLYNECDALVFATKAEGWGLPVIEAMACATPVIVTDYSAPREFVSERIGYLVRVEKMTEVRASIDYPDGQCGLWAQPDLEHLQHLMRHVYTRRDEARRIGRQAREEVCSRWTWDHAASKALSILGMT
jgi:glycosyltransferase involved in cell wall biosynthesis